MWCRMRKPNGKLRIQPPDREVQHGGKHDPAQVGNIEVPAAIDLGQNAVVAARMAANRATTSMNAVPGA